MKSLEITIRPNTPDVVISSEAIISNLNMSDKESSIKTVASYLREDIQDYCRSLPPLIWPPTVEDLCTESRLPPASVTLILTNLLKSNDGVQTLKVNMLVDSYSADFIHGASQGACITKKHFLVVFDPHNLAGKKKLRK